MVRYPAFLKNFIEISLYFFYVHLLFELIGVKLHHWTFPGIHYLGWVSFLNLQFPFEEFFFVLVLGGFATGACYELFADNSFKP